MWPGRGHCVERRVEGPATRQQKGYLAPRRSGESSKTGYGRSHRVRELVFELEGEVPLDGVEPRVEVLLLLLFPIFAAGLSLEKASRRCEGGSLAPFKAVGLEVCQPLCASRAPAASGAEGVVEGGLTVRPVGDERQTPAVERHHCEPVVLRESAELLFDVVENAVSIPRE